MEKVFSENKIIVRITNGDQINNFFYLEKLDGFDTKVLELKTVFNMKGNFGRKRRQAAMVVVGNGQGLAGFALGKAPEGRSALRKAKNRAAQKLMYIKLFRDHTGMNYTHVLHKNLLCI